VLSICAKTGDEIVRGAAMARGKNFKDVVFGGVGSNSKEFQTWK
jgi:hypothetical protein